MPTNALFNNLSATTLSSFIGSEIATVNATAAVVAAAGGPVTSGTASFVNGGGAVGMATEVASLGF